MSYRPALAGIPETMLLTLYGRAGEARRPNGILRDPVAVRIQDSLDYDFEKRFGAPNPLFALRARLIDGVLQRWLRRHPSGLVVSLGEGLETQAFRVDNGCMRWLSVDLPEAIRARELFLAPGGRFRHIAADASADDWIEEARGTAEVFVVAQGLLMYLEPASVEALLRRIAERLPRAELVFDMVSRDHSKRTLVGHWQTPDYRMPPMPWGVERREVRRVLRPWLPPRARIRLLPYCQPTHRPPLVELFLDGILPHRRPWQSMAHVTL